jgi:hypothetical protein
MPLYDHPHASAQKASIVYTGVSSASVRRLQPEFGKIDASMPYATELIRCHQSVINLKRSARGGDKAKSMHGI